MPVAIAPEITGPGDLAGAAFTEAANTGDYEPNVENPNNGAEALTDEQKAEANQAIAEVLSEKEIEATKKFLTGLSEDSKQLFDISVGVSEIGDGPKRQGKKRGTYRKELKAIEKMKKDAKMEPGRFDDRKEVEERFTDSFQGLVRSQAEGRLRQRVEQGDPSAIEAQKVVTAARAAELVTATADSLSATVRTSVDSPDNRSLTQMKKIENRYQASLISFEESLKASQAVAIAEELDIDLDEELDEDGFTQALQSSKDRTVAAVALVQESIWKELIRRKAIDSTDADWHVSQAVDGIRNTLDQREFQYPTDAGGNIPHLDDIVGIMPTLVFSDTKDRAGGPVAGLFNRTQNHILTTSAERAGTLRVKSREEIAYKAFGSNFNRQRAAEGAELLLALAELPINEQYGKIYETARTLAQAAADAYIAAREDPSADPPVVYSDEQKSSLLSTFQERFELSNGSPGNMLKQLLEKTILLKRNKQASRYDLQPGADIHHLVTTTDNYRSEEKQVLGALQTALTPPEPA